MLDRPSLSIDAIDRNDYRLPSTGKDRDWMTTLGYALLGSVLMYPLLQLSYLAFPLAFAGFAMLPFIVAVYLWCRDMISNTPRLAVTEIVAPVLVP